MKRTYYGPKNWLKHIYLRGSQNLFFLLRLSIENSRCSSSPSRVLEAAANRVHNHLQEYCFVLFFAFLSEKRNENWQNWQGSGLRASRVSLHDYETGILLAGQEFGLVRADAIRGSMNIVRRIQWWKLSMKHIHDTRTTSVLVTELVGGEINLFMLKGSFLIAWRSLIWERLLSERQLNLMFNLALKVEKMIQNLAKGLAVSARLLSFRKRS